MVINRKSKFLFIWMCCAMTLLSACYKKEELAPAEEYRKNALCNGDAKFYGDNIVTSIGGKLALIDFEKDDIIEYDVNANWIDSIEEEGIILYCNWNYEVGLCAIDNSDKTLVSNTLLFQEEKLAIDPSIIKISDKYYITITLIDGKVNNADENAANGNYTVKLYSSTDLKNWEFLSDIISVNSNIEDVELFYNDDQLYFIYEQETVDKGNSSIELKYSKNMGKSWIQGNTLVACTGDNEPGGLKWVDDNVYLFYSSDIGNVGMSYEGAEMYWLKLDNTLNPTQELEKIETVSQKGKLLYDIKVEDGMVLYLFTENYITESNLVIESNKIASIE